VSVKPGDTFVLTVVPEPGKTVREMRVSFLGVQPKMYAYGGRYKGLVPLGGRARAGTQPLYLKLFYTDGSTWGTTLRVTVTARHFATSHINSMPAAKQKYMDPELLRREREKLNAALAHSEPTPLWEGTWQQPVAGRVTSDFGKIRYVNGRYWGQHSGADIAAAAGTPVRADNHGRIVLAEMLEMRGGTILIDHGFNVFTEYNHLSEIRVAVGQRVRKGDVVGRVGATGFATGAHLHWGLRIGDTPVRPWNFKERGLSLE
jgi:murein DD-endopeptidase MepM/ murein hydrolase activator NlpD